MRSPSRSFGALALSLLLAACSDTRDLPPGTDGGTTTTPPPGPCRPFDVRRCYTGPAGTLGVGQCRQGQQACLPMGVAWGPCEGDVVPGDEDCTGTLADEDCDGEINEAGPTCVCPARSWEGCYEAAAETRGVGACRDGQRVCDDLGLAWSECAASVAPAPEDCLRPFDEDCNGDAPACPTDFALTFGDVSTGAFEDGEWVAAVAASPSGDFVVGGTAVGTFELDGTRYERPAGSFRYNGFVVRFTSSGEVVWAKRFIEGRSEITAVAFGPSGDVAIGGSMGGTIDFGGGPRTGVGHFVAVFDAGGVHRYSVTYSGGDNDDFVSDVALDAAGNLYYTARASRGVDLGGGPTDGNSALVSLDPVGAYRFGISYSASRTRMALASSGIAISGDGNSMINDFGGGTVDGDFVARFTLAGALEWAHGFDSYLDMMDVTSAPDGTVYALGSTSRFADFDGLPLEGEAGDMFLVQIAAAGTIRVVRLFAEGVLGPVNYGGPHHLEHTADGRLLVIGSFDGVFDLGAGPMPNVAQEDHFVALISTDTSTVHWMQRFGTPERDYRGTLHGTTDGTGSIVLGGQVRGPIDFGTGLLESRGSADALVVRLSP